jgi:hypothetical protein
MNTLDGDDLQNLVNNGTTNNVAMFLAPTAESISDVDDDYEYADASFLIPSGSSGASLTFILDAADYEIEANAGTYTPVLDPGTGNGTMLQLGGFVNKNADWNSFNPTTNAQGATVAPRSSIGVTTVYRYARATTAQETAMGNADLNWWNARFRPVTTQVQVDNASLAWADILWAAANRTAAAAAPFPGVYGLLSSSVTGLNVIEDAVPTGATAAAPKAGFVLSSSTVPVATVVGASNFHWFEFRSVEGNILPTAVGTAGTPNWTLTKNGANVPLAAATWLVNNTTSTAANTSISIQQAGGYPAIPATIAADESVINRVGLSVGTGVGVAAGDVFVVSVTVNGVTHSHTITFA